VEPESVIPFHFFLRNRPSLSYAEAQIKYREYCESEEKESCRHILEQIKRHVDNYGGISLITKTEDVCSFCGAKWTEGDGIHNGGCCEKDEAVMIAEEGEE
jgi:hypothetical protein